MKPTNDTGFNAALPVAGEMLVGVLVSISGLLFAAITQRTQKVQRWFLGVSLLTTIGWALLFLIGSVPL